MSFHRSKFFSNELDNNEVKLDTILTPRLCRADSRGVWQLPPRSSSCLLYLNGPAAALGVVTASAITGVTSTSGDTYRHSASPREDSNK